jgi:hypothetical protein
MYYEFSKEVFLDKQLFFSGTILSKEQLLFSFLCIEKQKKNSEWSEIFWNFLFLKIYLTFFFQEQLLFSFLCIGKQKKIPSDPKVFEKIFFSKTVSKKLLV